MLIQGLRGSTRMGTTTFLSPWTTSNGETMLTCFRGQIRRPRSETFSLRRRLGRPGPSPCGFNRQDLKIGQFMLNGFLDAVYDTPEKLGDPRKSRLGDAAIRAVGRLEAEFLKGNVRTHTDRLNAVAKACGFRSWHAVQCRRPKIVF